MNGYHSDTMWCDARSAAGQRLHSVRRSIYCWHTSVQNVIIDSKTDSNTLNALMHFLFSPACWAINSLVCTVLSVSRCDRRAMAVFVYTWMHYGREMWVARFEDDWRGRQRRSSRDGFLMSSSGETDGTVRNAYLRIVFTGRRKYYRTLSRTVLVKRLISWTLHWVLHISTFKELFNIFVLIPAFLTVRVTPISVSTTAKVYC